MKKSTWAFVIVLGISFYIASQWDKLPIIRNSVGAVLDPTLGFFLDLNVYLGFVVIVGFTSLILTLSQKYLSDQETLKDLKKEQKELQKQMKEFKEHPEKLLQLQKKQMEAIPKTFKLSMRPILYTSIPVILLFRWFSSQLIPVFGGWWILYYFIGAMIFSSIFRKLFKVA
jgi:uncharacterized membrane protein (DUF106 family)